MAPLSLRMALLLGLSIASGSLACGQIADDGSTPRSTSGSHSGDGAAHSPAASASPPASSGAGSAAPSGNSASPADDVNAKAKQPTPAVCQGASASPVAFNSTDSFAVAVHGVWRTCAGSGAAICPAGDSILLIGDLNIGPNAASRAATCGNLTSHGSGFTADPSAVFTYEILNAGAGSFSFHAWNATVDHTFDLVYYSDGSSAPSSDALSLSSAATSTALQITGFTTF